MTKGTTLTLHGDQAETFVRTRRSIGVGTNEARMARQEQYIQKLATQLDAEVKQNQSFVLTAYDAMEPYLYTNIPRGQLANEVWAAKDYERTDTIKPDLSLTALCGCFEPAVSKSGLSHRMKKLEALAENLRKNLEQEAQRERDQ